MSSMTPAAGMPYGLCKLTKRPGRFVNSHIIPQALTRPSSKENPLFQYGAGHPPVRRWSSWYDPKLVTTEGEQILADLDTWAIDQLRRQRLVWSGWRGESSLGDRHTMLADPIGARRVSGIDPRKLRLFFLSLLWRAAATDLQEFSEINLHPEALEHLRRMVLTGETLPLSFYPCQLTQLSTKGLMHNYTPIREMKQLPSTLGYSNHAPLALPSFRFYFDGLIVHMHPSFPVDYGVDSLGSQVVGAGDTLVLSTVTFAGSLQRMEMNAVQVRYGLDET